MRDLGGFLAVNKPRKLTSRDVVDLVQRRLPTAKIGHCGTLDPLAEGVLVLAVGRARRLTQFVQELPKRYVANLRLGFVSATWDVEAPLERSGEGEEVSEEELRRVLQQFTGVIEQVPPEFSAVRVKGRRAYELARRGKGVELESRRVRIYRLELRKFEPPDVEIEVECGKGTYIRSLVRDIGRALGCGAVMTALVRTGIGPFTLDDACSLEVLRDESRPIRLLPVALAVPHLASARLDEAQVSLVAHGRPLRAELVRIEPPQQVVEDAPSDRVALYGPEGQLIAVGVYDQTSGLIRPRIVLFPA